MRIKFFLIINLFIFSLAKSSFSQKLLEEPFVVKANECFSIKDESDTIIFKNIVYSKLGYVDTLEIMSIAFPKKFKCCRWISLYKEDHDKVAFYVTYNEDSLLDGDYLVYWLNQKVKEKGYYSSGKLTAKETYYKNGDKESKIDYSDESVITYMVWFTNGNLSYLETFKKNPEGRFVRHGASFTFKENSVLKDFIIYDMGSEVEW